MKLAILLASAVAVNAACLPVRGGHITAADMAAAVPAFAQLPPQLELSFSPNPGVTRVFAPAELNGRLSRHGINAVATESVCFEWPMRTLTDDEVRSAMLTVLPDGSEVELAGPAQNSAPPGRLEFPLDTLRNGMWRGHVTYGDARRFPVTVQVTVRSPWTRVIATEPIRAGDRVTEANVQLTTGMGEPARGQYVDNLPDVIGRVARRLIRADAPVERTALGEARVVARGDAVRVDVVSGGATLRFEGIAQAPGAAGALVPVKNPDTGKIVHARVDSEGHARVDLSGKEN